MAELKKLEELRELLEEAPTVAFYKCPNGLYAIRSNTPDVAEFPLSCREELTDFEQQEFNHVNELRIHRIRSRDEVYR